MTRQHPTAEEYERAWIKWDCAGRSAAPKRVPLFTTRQRLAIQFAVLAGMVIVICARLLAKNLSDLSTRADRLATITIEPENPHAP